MNILRTTVIAVVLCLPLLGIAQKTITVMGAGSAVVKPDNAIISFTSAMQDVTVQGVFAKSEATMAAIKKALAAAGGQDLLMRTFALNPTYDYSQPTSNPKVVGYTLITYYQATVADLKSLPKALDAAAGAGATNVTVDSYASSKAEGMEEDAMADALLMARERASFLAKRMGGTVGDILEIRDAAADGGGGGGAVMSEHEREEQERRGSMGRINPQAIVRSVALKVTFSVK